MSAHLLVWPHQVNYQVNYADHVSCEQVHKMSLQTMPMSTVAKRGKTLIWSTRNGDGATSSASAAAVSAGEARAAKGIGVIVAVFVVSWLPLYTINTLLYFCPDCRVPCHLIDVCIVLSHFNSVWNPALYAWGVRDFRVALRQLVCGAGANGVDPPNAQMAQSL